MQSVKIQDLGQILKETAIKDTEIYVKWDKIKMVLQKIWNFWLEMQWKTTSVSFWVCFPKLC